MNIQSILMSTQKVYIKAMCFKKASQVKEVLHTFMKNFGKIDKVGIIDTDTIDGQDGNCASTFHAIVIFKANVILNKIQSTSKVKIFLWDGLPDKLSLDTWRKCLDLEQRSIEKSWTWIGNRLTFISSGRIFGFRLQL